MSLIHKAIWIVIFVTLLSLAVSFVGQRFLVIPELENIEAIADQKNIERVQLGIQLIQYQIAKMAYDHAIWDATIEYFSDRNSKFVQSNFIDETFINHKINLLAFVDIHSEIIWSKQVDFIHSKAVVVDQKLLEYLVIQAENLLADSPDSLVVNGVYTSTPFPVALSVSRVMNSDETGPSPGIFLAARFIDKSFTDEISSLFNVEFTTSLVTAADKGVASDISSLRRGDEPIIIWLMLDSLDKPMLKIKSVLGPRGFDERLISTPIILSTFAVIFIWSIVFYLLRHFLISPIVQVAVHLVKVRETGDYSLRLYAIKRSDEIGILNNECNALLQHAQIQAESLLKLSLINGLTQLSNRRHFDEVIDEQWILQMRAEVVFGLMICDIDFFKLYNDNYGHLAGDETLKKVAQAIKSCARRESELAARIGGEEFAILMPATDIKGCRFVANRVLEAVLALDIPHQYSTLGKISVSIGIAAVVPPRNSSAKYLYNKADKALYLAKKRGRSRIEEIGNE